MEETEAEEGGDALPPPVVGDATPPGSRLWDAYRETLLAVSSLAPPVLGVITRSLVERLLPVPDDDPAGAGRERPPPTGQIIRIIQSLVKQCPSSTTYLMPSIEFFFPFHRRPLHDHRCFVTGLLALAEALPTWRYRILELILGKTLIIDVELQNDVELLRLIDSDLEASEGAESPLSDESISSHDGGQTGGADQQNLERIREGCRKLDTILALLLDHIGRYTAHPSGGSGCLNESRAREMFNFLLTVFERSILPTFKSRNLQFLSFHLSSQMPASADQFLGLLFQPLVQFCRGVDAGRRAVPNPRLLLSVAYIGSYVARAGFLSGQLVKAAFQMLLDLVSRLLAQSRIGSPPVLTIIALQHILYIFRWRWSELLDLVDEDVLADDFALVLGEQGDILQYCSPAIVEPFVEVAGVLLGLLSTETTRRYRKGGDAQRRPSEALNKYAEMGAYLPFDPPLGLPVLRSLLANPAVYRSDPPDHLVELDSKDYSEGEEIVAVDGLGTAVREIEPASDRDQHTGDETAEAPKKRRCRSPGDEESALREEEQEFHSDSSHPSL